MSSRQGGIIIDQITEHVACGAAYNSDEHFVTTELFLKKEQREMFMTIHPDQRLSWLRRKYNVMYGGKKDEMFVPFGDCVNFYDHLEMMLVLVELTCCHFIFLI